VTDFKTYVADTHISEGAAVVLDPNTGRVRPAPTNLEPPERISHPRHYNQHPSGVEAIVICERLNFNLGNAVKYLFRQGHKGTPEDDKRKALWYLAREVSRLTVERVRLVDYTDDDVAVKASFSVIVAEGGPSLLAKLLELIYQAGGFRPSDLRALVDAERSPG